MNERTLVQIIRCTNENLENGQKAVSQKPT